MTLKLHSLFTHHMVLQRHLDAPVWGWARPGERVRVALAGQGHAAVADTAGKWMVRLHPLDAGGPFVLEVSGTDGTSVKVNDVLVGDVYVCSGQSNMEMAVASAANREAEVAAANFPGIRQFHVPCRLAAEPQADVEAAWEVCSRRTVATFSAAAYFFARELHQTQRVPIGLINTSWGGTLCEAWTSRAALRADPHLQALAERRRQAEKADPAVKAAYLRELVVWETANYYADPGVAEHARGWSAAELDTHDWKSMELPTDIGAAGLIMNGAIWFRRALTVPAAWAGRDLTISLGAIDDYDDTYFNGVRVGGMNVSTRDSWAQPRSYTVPGKLVKVGHNTIAVRVFDKINDGGLRGPAAQMQLVPAPTNGTPADEEALALTGAWLYKIELRLERKMNLPPGPVMPPMLDDQNCPAVLFDGMLHPLIPYGIRGAIWYQGESNADRAEQYRKLFPAMIRNWRADWKQGDFPFLFVELARWQAPQPEPAESVWAELREAQAEALKLLGVGRATIIDTGDTFDIHPKDKQTVGHRLALAARAIVYGEPIEAAGPTFAAMTPEAGALRLRFTHTGGGLAAAGGGTLRGFAIAGADRKFVWAQAVIQGDTVVVRSAQVPQPVAVRYAWADNPDCNLANGAGIPASPFRTDEWPGITAGRA